MTGHTPWSEIKHRSGTKSVHIGFVLDMSGSMLNTMEATVNGTIKYLRDLRKVDPNTRLTLTVFDDVIETWVENTALCDVKIKTTLSKYKPRNMTALYDAMGQTIEILRKATRETITPGDVAKNKVIIVVMTDGQENCSRKYDRRKIADLVQKLTNRGNWTFVYLGANVDAWSEANKMGISVGNTMHYSSTDGSTRSAFSGLVTATGMTLSSAAGQSSTFFGDAGVAQDVRDKPQDDPSDDDAPLAAHPSS